MVFGVKKNYKVSRYLGIQIVMIIPSLFRLDIELYSPLFHKLFVSLKINNRHDLRYHPLSKGDKTR